MTTTIDDKYIITITKKATVQEIADIFGVSIEDVLEGKLGLYKLDEDDFNMSFVDKIGVHASHCCKWHGCKYGDEDCPVVTGKVEQEFLCEWCYQDLENEEYHKQVLKDIEEMKRFKK